MRRVNRNRYSSHLYNETDRSALKVKAVDPVYSEDSPVINAREILQRNFDHLFEKNPLLVTFGEDTGKIGDVNKGLEGLQEKYGEVESYRYRHQGNYDHRTGYRNGIARFKAHCRNPVFRLPVVWSPDCQ